ncbi:hypothetical protein PFICI_10974 [Pestalotiopsis fici W106-1]|uniref:Heterokaryon incompatibility domain-containing protein n=1 Tax=Pestalotiopsis fici (strain W106-1 / CGMCC3.15140) TaxID=1229662 RepID=W3WTC3_PESFW|nr:uncharacterized protein PFICI_10974 [Pestalotiopsis fici W106-1]ETS77100.1 hypothetical protein PFICI_10974 [Pestalotiopsis fici W106-1]
MAHAQEPGALLWTITVFTCKAWFVGTIYTCLGMQFVVVLAVLYFFIGVLNFDLIVRRFSRRMIRRTRRRLRLMQRLPLIEAITSVAASVAGTFQPVQESIAEGTRSELDVWQLHIGPLAASLASLVSLVVSSVVEMLIVPISIKAWRLFGVAVREAVEDLGLAAHTIESSCQHIPGYLTARARLSRCFWVFFNSTAADRLADCLLVWRSLLVHGNNYLSRGLSAWISKTLDVLDLAGYKPYKNNIKEVLGFSQHFAIILEPLIRNFYKESKEITLDEIRRVSAANALVYGSTESLTGEQYEAIETRVRLIKLLPGRDNVALRCSFMTVDLYDPLCPEFEALSYAWGSFDLEKYIRVNGKPFEVSNSLHEALLHLRREREPRMLWIDALSINQNDIEERGSQVLLMGHIYSKASKVVVWLGNSEPWGLRHAIRDTKVHMFPGKQQRVQSELVHVGLLHVVRSLLRRSWWTRAWVVQELVRARAVEMQCGCSTLDWEHFCALIDAIGGSTHRKTLLDSTLEAQPEHSPMSSSPFSLRKSHLAEFQSLQVARKAWRANLDCKLVTYAKSSSDTTQWNNSADLLSLVYLFRGRRATDPRDKVFAFLGLVDNRDALIIPDYDQTPSLLSIEFARRHIRLHRKLSVIALAEFARELNRDDSHLPSDNIEDYLPSWCPAFMSTGSIRHGLYQAPFWTGFSYPEDNFAAADGLSNVIAIDKNEALRNRFSPGCKEDDVYTLLVQAVKHLGSAVVEAERLSDSDGVSTTQRDFNCDKLFAKWQGIADFAIEKRSRFPESSFPGTSLSRDALVHLTVTAGKFCAMPPSTDPSERTFYLQTRADTCRNRQLFLTKNGLLGLGPKGLRIGDEVKILLGMQAPVMLRRVETTDGKIKRQLWKYIYLGQVYIHELMVYKGNLQEDIKSRSVSLEDLLLV